MHALWFLGSLLVAVLGGIVVYTAVAPFPHDPPWFVQVTCIVGVVIVLAGLGSAIASVIEDL